MVSLSGDSLKAKAADKKKEMSGNHYPVHQKQ